MSDDRQWGQVASGTSGDSGDDAMEAVKPVQPSAAGGPQGPAPEGERKGGLLRRKAKAPKEPKMKAEKAPKAARAPRARAGAGGGGGTSLLSLSDEGPSREELERMAAEELMTAISPSLDLLRMEVPDATSPDEAQRKIESKLGPSVPDRDAGIPSHPIYSGDALVYYQLRRHYGRPHAGGSFARGWFPLQER